MTHTHTMKIGLISIGLDTYWPQFPGLREKLGAYSHHIATQAARPGVEIVSAGMVDSITRACEAAHQLRRADVDLLLIHVATYALSSTVLPILRRLKIPILVLNLAPEPAMDYTRFNSLRDEAGNPDRAAMTGEWLAFCGACPVPELANVFARAGIPFHQVTGTLHNDPIAWTEIHDWIDAAHVAFQMEHNRLGVLGHPYSGMLDVYSDLTLQSIRFGTHIELLEVDELSAVRRTVTDHQITDRIQHFHATFEIEPTCPPPELARAARTSVALDQLAARYHLGSLAYYYKGSGIAENEDTMSSIILGSSLLTARHIPVAGECEVKNAQAMKILDLFGVGGSFTEYYALDLTDDVVLMGHDGPGHVAIAQGRPKVRALGVFHGKVGRGLSIEMSVQHGSVTLLSIVEDGPTLKLLVAQGKSVPGPILEIGNTNSRYRFPLGARAFTETWNSHGPAHHCAIGLGHIAPKLKKLAALLQLPFIQI
jgi:L-arabinose isomerase